MDASDSQFLRKPSLPGLERALAAAPCLRRIGRDHLYAELAQSPPNLCQSLPVNRLARLWRQPEMARTVRIQSTEYPSFFDHFLNSGHHGPRRFFIDQLCVIDLTRRIIHDHDQVVPTPVLKPLVLRSVDMQQHPGERPPITLLAVHPSLWLSCHQS